MPLRATLKFPLAVACILICLTSQTVAVDRSVDVDPHRVDELAVMLPKSVFAFGPPITDRVAWEDLGRRPAFRTTVAKAERLSSEPIAALPDDLFLEFSRTGNREHYEHIYFNRTGRLTPLVIAECVEHRGRFIPAIQKLIAAFAEQKTWMLPAHDPTLNNFHGHATDVDLFSSALACDLANAKYLLGNSLDIQTRMLIDENVRRRVVDPFREMVTGKRKPLWWLTAKNNWNAVCLANVLGTALAVLPDRHDRAVFAAAAEQDSRNYLDGFDNDGYCLEGLGYWNYGFGNYARLCELLYQATGGRLDCFAGEKIKAIAEYPGKVRIVGDVYPAYGDVHLDAVPWPALVDFVDRRFQLASDNAAAPTEVSSSLGGSLGETLMMSCPNSASGKAVVSPKPPTARDWFPDAQVLTCRAGPGSGAALAVSIKGGRNGVNHGHDDLGSFVLVEGATTLLIDPGTEVYTARTFSKNRYQSEVINSFGHNVPLVAGRLQTSTSAAQTKILNRDFGDSVDTIVMDLTSAYPVAELTQLTRTFTYDRGGAGSLTVEDECRFSSPESYGVQFITFGQWKKTSPTQLIIWEEHQAIRIDLTTTDDVEMKAETIEEDLPQKQHPVHISIDLKSPAKNITMKAVIRSTAMP